MSSSIKYMVADRATSSKYMPIFVGVGIVVLGVVAFVVIKKVLEKTGIVDTKFDNRLPRLNGFNPEYYKGNISKVTISNAMALKIAQDVHDSSGWATSVEDRNFKWTGPPILLNDQEELLHGAIQQAGSEYNLSKVADTFQKKYSENMASYIIDFADNSDTEAIFKIIKDYKS